MILWVLVAVAWIGNLIALTECDFRAAEPANFKCEVIHAVGLIPPAALVTVWFHTDKPSL